MNKSSCIPSRFKNKSTAHSQYLALESRLVFDGAVVATAVDAQNVVNNDTSTEHTSVTQPTPSEPTINFSPENTAQTIDYRPNAETTNDQPAFPTATDLLNSINSAFVTGANTDQKTTVIVVDPRADNAALLSLNPPVNTQVIVLDSTRDGFQQVSEQLQSRQDVTELHLVPWNKDNQQWLGSKALTASLEPSVNDSLMSWNDGLVDNAKVLFHGQDSMGTAWLEHISALTSTQASWSANTDFAQNDTTLLTDNPSTATTLVFIDSAVKNSADIVSAIDSSAEIVYLDTTKDGLTQIADYLEGRSGIDSIQIISHSNQAALHLGNDTLTNDNLASHADQLVTIGQSLTVNGDILFYGCELAKSTKGSQFIDTFAYLTQADVAASTDITGAASKGGNWTLEYTAGTIEASILAASHYQDILALPSFDVTNIPLVFNTPILQKGNGQNTGDVVIFNNVATVGGQAIDAVVTTVDNTSINITGFDTASGTLPASINPNWFELDTSSTVSGGASTIKFEFIISGTYNPVTGLGDDVLLQNLTVNSYDIDNGQFQDFSGFSSYSVASNTTLAQSNPGNFVHFADTVPTPNNNVGVPGSPVFNQARVTATYDSINAFQIKTGSSQTTGVAHFYLDFSTGFTWDPPPVTYGIPTADSLVTHDFTPTLTGTYKPNVIGSTDTAQSLTITVNGITYTSTNGLIPTNGLTWSNGIWSLDIATANALPPATYDIAVDTGYGPDINNISPHTKDITINELVVINDPPVNTVPVGQTVNVGVQTAILGLSTTDINDNLASAALSVVGGTLNVDLIGGATIIGGVNGTGNLILGGTEAQIKAALATVNYTANNGISIDTLSILSTDKLGLTDLDTVAINVNRPPIAVDDTKIGIVGQPVTVNVLNNDSDPDNNLDPTTVKIVGTTNVGDSLVVAGQGTWSVNTVTGDITFTPIAGFILNPTPINYTVKDTSGLESATAKVTVTVSNPPIAVDDTKTGIVGQPVTVNVLNNDSDPENNLDPTTVKIVGTTNVGDSLVVAGQGTWSVNAVTGDITFTPIVGFTQSPTPINYTVKDTSGLESAAAKVTVTVINPPIAVDDTKTGIVGQPVTVNVLNNDSDPDNNLDPTSVKIAGTTNVGDPLVVAGQGTWSVNTVTGDITFTPIAGFTQSPTPINYTVKDTSGLESATAKVTLTVINPPIAVDDTKTGNAGTPITVNVLGNDRDPDNNLDPTSVKIVGTTNPGDPLVVAGQGTWSVNALTGDITFTPIAGFTQSPTPINYTVKDTSGLESATAKVTLTVINPPIAVDDTKTGNAGTPITVNVLGNDRDPDNNLDPKTVKIVGTTNPGDPLVVAGQGTWSVNAITGDITFTPIAGFNLSPTPISYTVKDTSGLESTAATITVKINTIPVAIADINIVTEGNSTVTGNIITNEAALGDEPTEVMSARQGTTPIPIGSVFVTAAGGFLIINTDGSYRYTAPSNLPNDRLIETFNYTIIDSNGDTSSSVLTILGPDLPIVSGSVILLSNPPASPIFPDPEIKFFSAPPFISKPIEFAKPVDLRLYIPSPDGVISLTGSLRDQVVLELKRFSFDIPSWSFRHTNPNAQLEFEATQPDGTSLPNWLRFDPKRLIFSGIPPKGAHNEVVMVTATDAYGNEVHALFNVHVNKERVRPDHKSLSVDPKLLGLPNKVLEKQHHKEKPVPVGKSGLSERMHTVGKLGKLQESRALLDSLKGR